MREPSARPAKGNAGGWIHRLADGAGEDRVPAAARSAPGRPLASLERRNRVYRRLLSLCPLNSKHRQSLLTRGCSEEEIKQGRYGTLPLRGRAGFCREIAAVDALALDGVPGFHRRDGKGGDYWTLAGAPGLLIPCRAPDGHIRGVRIRPDDPGEEGKYRWLSSADRPGGTGSGVHCHIARPVTVRDNRVWIVEGEIKANISSARLGAVVISIPGVDSWARALPDALELLPADGHVVVALDADWRGKPPVHLAAWSLALALQTLHFCTEVALWNVTHKGLDDLLTAGQMPSLHKLEDALPAPVWSPKISSRLMADAPSRTAARPLLPAGRLGMSRSFRRRWDIPVRCA
jgi:hypothetical protein